MVPVTGLGSLYRVGLLVHGVHELPPIPPSPSHDASLIPSLE